MSVELNIEQMTLGEKLRAMEFESPLWHETVLKEREERSREGLERPIDWETAKDELRRRFK